jgi:alpha-mannosidase
MGGETSESETPKSTYPKLSAHPVGKWIPNIYRDRIGMFYSRGQYESKNLRAYVKDGFETGALLISC